MAFYVSKHTPLRTGGPVKPPVEETYGNISYNFMTLVDECKKQYWWIQHRNMDLAASAISEKMNAGPKLSILEDSFILEAAQI